MNVKSLSRVRLLVIPWTTAYQFPPSMGFSRQEYWSAVPLTSLQYTSKFGKLSSGHRTRKVRFHSNAKECSNYHTIALISRTSKVMLKILQARIQQYVNHEPPDVQAVFRKVGESEIKLPTSVASSKKQESSRKTSTSALLTMPKPLTVWITTDCGKFLKRWEYQKALTAS